MTKEELDDFAVIIIRQLQMRGIEFKSKEYTDEGIEFWMYKPKGFICLSEDIEVTLYGKWDLSIHKYCTARSKICYADPDFSFDKMIDVIDMLKEEVKECDKIET